MEAGWPVRRDRILCAVWLVYLFLRTLQAGLTDTHSVTEWTLADWLINYRAGFVRRGLTGQIILLLSPVLHLSPILLAMLFAMACYGILFYAVWRLLARSSWDTWILAALCSPATFSFAFLDPTAGFHKEILFLAALALLLLLLRQTPAPDDRVLVGYLSLACAFCILSHESLAFYMPYLFAALAIGLGSVRRAIKVLVVPSLFSAASFYAVLRHRGSTAMAEVICAPLRRLDPWICGGSIGYLGRDETFAHQSLVADAVRYHYATIFPVLALLSLVPVFMAYRSLRRDSALRFHLRLLAATAAISFVLSLALFYVAADWGRWIYIHVVSLVLILFFIDHGRQSGPATAPPQGRIRRVLAIGLLLLYATAWDMPNYGDQPLFGYLGQIAGKRFNR